jgi:hypothetical protein
MGEYGLDLSWIGLGPVAVFCEHGTESCGCNQNWGFLEQPSQIPSLWEIKNSWVTFNNIIRVKASGTGIVPVKIEEQGCSGGNAFHLCPRDAGFETRLEHWLYSRFFLFSSVALGQLRWKYPWPLVPFFHIIYSSLIISLFYAIALCKINNDKGDLLTK